MVPYFATDDINAAAAKAAELGGTVFMGPMVVPEAGTMALVSDPTGAVHGLWQAGLGRDREDFADDDAIGRDHYRRLTSHYLVNAGHAAR